LSISGHIEKQLPSDPFNEYSFAIQAKAKAGEDFHLWSFIYEQKRDEIIDGDVIQNATSIQEVQRRGKKKYTHPTVPFVNKGQDIDDYYPPGSLQIEKKDDSVTWEVGDRTHIG
jgi:hypothetical protein